MPQHKTFQPDDIKLEIPKSERKQLLELSYWKTPLLIVALYVWFVLLVMTAKSFPYFSPLAILLIAGMQNHLLILVHEGAHGLIYPDRKINDWMTDLCCAIPCFTRIRDYRAFHFKHHRFTGDPDRDPEIRFYAAQGYHFQRRRGFELVKSFLSDLFLLNMIKFAVSQAKFLGEEEASGQLKAHSLVSKITPLVFWISIVALSLYFNLFSDLLLFWLLPAVTLMFLFLKLHGYGEHSGSSSKNEIAKTFTRDYSFVCNYFLYPIGSGYHLEHHLYPQVPWYRMKEVRASLRNTHKNLEEQQQLTFSRGYFSGKTSIWKSMIFGSGEYRKEHSL